MAKRELSQTHKGPKLSLGAFLILIGRLPTLPHTRACSTIGAERLNYRVRDGNGWDPLARITQKRTWKGAYSPPRLNIDGTTTMFKLAAANDRYLSGTLKCLCPAEFTTALYLQ